jgi:putative ABC transport system permease protein
VDGSLPPFQLRTLRQQVEGGWVQERLFASLSGFFGLLALLLAAVGLYGVIAYSVSQRTREIGIRSTLGARPSDVMGLVLQHGLKLTAFGILIGLASAFVLTRLIRNRLFGIEPTDPITFAIVSVLLTGVALLASWLPARRAARIDPMEALRYE